MVLRSGGGIVYQGQVKGGKHRAKHLGKEGYQEMGRKGGVVVGLSSTREEVETRETTPTTQDIGPKSNKENIKEILVSNLDPAEKLKLIVDEHRLVDKENVCEVMAMFTPEEREELEMRTHAGEVVVLGERRLSRDGEEGRIVKQLGLNHLKNSKCQLMSPNSRPKAEEVHKKKKKKAMIIYIIFQVQNLIVMSNV
jgi:general stress protein YciG